MISGITGIRHGEQARRLNVTYHFMVYRPLEHFTIERRPPEGGKSGVGSVTQLRYAVGVGEDTRV